MLRYVDDSGQIRLRMKSLEVPIVPESKTKRFDYRRIEEEAEQIRRGDGKPKAFWCIKVNACLSVVAVWEVLSIFYYLGFSCLRWLCKCSDYFFFLYHPHRYAFCASCLLAPTGFLLLMTLPKRILWVAFVDLGVHIICTIIFFVAFILCAAWGWYGSLALYLFLTICYIYLVVLYNFLMRDLSNNKYDLIQKLAYLGRKFYNFITK